MTAPVLLLQIVPTTPGGVPDFAERLQGCWASEGVRSAIFPTDADSTPPSSLMDTLASEPAVSILLHFSGYGYARRGLCRWLVRDLAWMLRSHPDIELITFFHETYAKGPPWRSAFWTSLEQRGVALAAGRMSKMVLTNTAFHRDWLMRNLRLSQSVRAMPVFSNVGEVKDGLIPASRRTDAAVLFGSAAVRRRTFRHPGLGEGLRALGIDRIVEIGPGESVADGAFPVDFRGRIPAAEVSELLANTRYGLVSYALPHVEKSGILAAYTAHGCIPVLTNRRRGPSPVLVHGRHFLRLGDARPGQQALDRIGAEAHAWYQPHRVAEQARELKSVLLDARAGRNPPTGP
jgi:hypothetical protein